MKNKKVDQINTLNWIEDKETSILNLEQNISDKLFEDFERKPTWEKIIFLIDQIKKDADKIEDFWWKVKFIDEKIRKLAKLANWKLDFVIVLLQEQLNILEERFFEGHYEYLIDIVELYQELINFGIPKARLNFADFLVKLYHQYFIDRVSDKWIEESQLIYTVLPEIIGDFDNLEGFKKQLKKFVEKQFKIIESDSEVYFSLMLDLLVQKWLFYADLGENKFLAKENFKKAYDLVKRIGDTFIKEIWMLQILPTMIDLEDNNLKRYNLILDYFRLLPIQAFPLLKKELIETNDYHYVLYFILEGLFSTSTAESYFIEELNKFLKELKIKIPKKYLKTIKWNSQLIYDLYEKVLKKNKDIDSSYMVAILANYMGKVPTINLMLLAYLKVVLWTDYEKVLQVEWFKKILEKINKYEDLTHNDIILLKELIDVEIPGVVITSNGYEIKF